MKRPEQELSILVNQFLIRALPLDAVHYHVPNGGKRTLAESVAFKAMGVKPGVPDFMVHIAGRTFGIELKAGKGRESEAQTVMAMRLELAGVPCCVARSVDEVQAFLERHQVQLRPITR